MGLPNIEGSVAQIMGWGTVQTVAISSATARSTALTAGVKAVRLWCDVDIHVAFGGSGINATTSDAPMTAKIPEIIAIVDSSFIAGIRQSGANDGTLYIVEQH